MTHSSFSWSWGTKQVPWSECYVERYHNNNGIVLKWGDPQTPNNKVLFFIDGDDIGLSRLTETSICIKRATPILRTMLEIHNRAVKFSFDAGREDAKAEIRKALGL